MEITTMVVMVKSFARIENVAETRFSRRTTLNSFGRLFATDVAASVSGESCSVVNWGTSIVFQFTVIARRNLMMAMTDEIFGMRRLRKKKGKMGHEGQLP